jgi:Leucine-rich repeat (LRR) protein
MRISSELVDSSTSLLNPLGYLELDLRGNNIDTIENLSVIKDFYRAIDFTDNRISRLENFAKLNNLNELYFCNNKISFLDSDFGKSLTNLKVLNLQNNNISKIEDILPLKYCTQLEQLILIGNPITETTDYEQQILTILPDLKILDFQFISPGKKLNPVAGKYSSEKLKTLLNMATTSNDIDSLLSIEKQL